MTTERDISRRTILLGACSAVAILACGDDGDPASSDGDPTGSGGTHQGGAHAGGSHAGGANAGGTNAGGAAPICGAALLVRGSNYASDPHDLAIPLADLEAGVAKSYTTTGVGHTHTVSLTEGDFAALRNGEIVKKYICYDNPGSTDHEFVISCADPEILPTFEGEIGTNGNCPA